MNRARYLVATNLLCGESKLIAATVIYRSEMKEPSFVYTLRGRKRTAYLYRRGDHVPLAIEPALTDHIQSTAVSWALVTAHPACAPEQALALSVVRAMERWVCRENTLPNLSETCLLLATRKILTALPENMRQIPHVKDWHTSAARALCRHRAQVEALR